MGDTPTSSSRTNVPVASDIVRLPDVLAAIEVVLAAAEELAAVAPPLRARVEANRLRSERHNRVTRGEQPREDTRTVVTRTGRATECVRCRRILSIEAQPRLVTFRREGE